MRKVGGLQLRTARQLGENSVQLYLLARIGILDNATCALLEILEGVTLLLVVRAMGLKDILLIQYGLMITISPHSDR
ncbi:MAG: hypothetical protein F4239_06150 [Gammaproteobacteria bacterium]|nr:hypothetical protein [Gammaproteobacteria bacterium]MYI89894.1 hypothetical protein [Gammaproteobacteria bacterium]